MIRAIRHAVLGILAFFSCAAAAEDIDIYFGAANGANTNVLIVLDNTSNWSAANQNWPDDPACPSGVAANTCRTQGYYELKALKQVITNLESTNAANPMAGDSAVNVGLMLFNDANSTRNGGYVRSAIRPMTAANKALFVNTVDQIILDFNGEQGPSAGQYATLLFDAFKYFGGYTNPTNATADSAPASNPTFGGVPAFGTPYWGSLNAVGGRADPDAYSGQNYVPYSDSSSECGGKNAIIFIGNGFPSSDTSPLGMDEALQKLLYLNTSTSVSELPLPTATCSNPMTNVSGFSCQSTSNCALALPTDTDTTLYQCARSNCGGNNARVQSCSARWTLQAPSGSSQNRYAHNFTEFLYNTDVASVAGQQNIVTHTVNVCKDQCDNRQASLLRGMADRGGGKYFKATNPDQIAAEIEKAFLEVIARNSVFVSASLPVSVNTQGTYLNQVFMGMFRPVNAPAGPSPRWVGNLKRYEFAYDTGTDSVLLVDADGTSAVNSSTGFVSPNAKSIWTHTSKSADTSDEGFWRNNPQGMATSPADRKDDTPDGEIVEKGGVAGRIRTDNLINQSSRKVFTCPSAGCASNTVLSTWSFGYEGVNPVLSSTSDLGGFGVSDADDFNALIDWIRGKDNLGNEAGPGGTVTVRPSVHGDVLHSRPVALSYASLNKVVVFYGANDGFLRAIDAGTITGTEGGVPENLESKGKELWSFVAPEHYGQFKRLRDREPTLRLDGNGDMPKDYFFDGSPGVYQEVVDGEMKAWLFVPVRRGGRFVYAFDVSNPSAPKFMWKISNTSSGFAELGQTWSTPKVTKLKGAMEASDGTAIAAGSPVLIFGAGYAGGFSATSPYARVFEDLTPAVTSYTYGRGVFIVDAESGKLIRFLGDTVSTATASVRSVPSDVTLVDANFDGFTDTAYVGDLGGSLWRMEVEKLDADALVNDPAEWTLTKVASLGGKFFYPPDVVLTSGFKAILIGSGNREDPKRQTGQDYFYMVKDTGGSGAVVRTDLRNVNDSIVASPGDAGWYLPLRVGEKVVNAALTVGGTTYFGTNQPGSSDNVCVGGLGIARSYSISFLGNALATQGELIGGGLPPSPVAGIVEIDVDGRSTLVPFIVGGGTRGSSIEAEKVTISVPPIRRKSYWYSRED